MNLSDSRANSRALFATTNWSLVVGARSSEEALAQLLALYWGPVYAYIRRSGRGPADAADLTQEFLAEVLIGRDLLLKPDPARGRFRGFLQRAVRNFLIDQHRRGEARRRSPAGGIVSLDPTALAHHEPAATDSPDEAFDRNWATRVLSIAVERVERECREGGLGQQWGVFEATVVGPALHATQPPRLTDLAEQIGAESPAQVSNMIQTVKRRFRRVLRGVIAETVADPAEVDDELAALVRYLGAG